MRRIERKRAAGAEGARADLIRGALRGDLPARIAQFARAGQPIAARQVKRAEHCAAKIRADVAAMDR